MRTYSQASMILSKVGITARLLNVPNRISETRFNHNSLKRKKHECIPAGYVPSAAVAVRLGGVCPVGVSAQEGSAQWGGGLSRGGSAQEGSAQGCLLSGGVCPVGVSAQWGCLPSGGCLPMGGVCPGGCLPRGCLSDTSPPHVNRMTDACENDVADGNKAIQSNASRSLAASQYLAKDRCLDIGATLQ